MILIDPRHPHPDQPERGLLPHTVFVQRFQGAAYSASPPLQYGDLAFWSCEDRGVCIEVKKAQDVVDSVAHTGRLIQQLRAARADAVPWYWVLVLEGWKYVGMDSEGDLAVRRRGTGLEKVVVPGSSPPRGIPYRRVDNVLNTLAIVEGVPIKVTGSEAETVQVVLDLYHWFQKPVDEHTSTTDSRLYTPVWLGPSGQTPLVLHWAAACSGIGVKRAKAVREQFPSALAFAQAGVEDLAEVDGIGKATAAKVWREVRREQW